jgi:hypothetical protein
MTTGQEQPEFLDDMEPQARFRTLTYKGEEHFKKQLEDRSARLTVAWTKVDSIIKAVDSCIKDAETLTVLQEKLEHYSSKHATQTQELLDFLRRTNTEESLEQMESFKFLHSGYCLLIDNTKSKIQNLLDDAQHKDLQENKTQSVHSRSDVSSEFHSSVLARKRAKAEAAKVTLEFAIKEAQLRKEQACALEKHLLEEATAKAAAARKKAEIDAELELLTLKRKAAETKTEADYLESEHSRSTSRHSSIHSLP